MQVHLPASRLAFVALVGSILILPVVSAGSDALPSPPALDSPSDGSWTELRTLVTPTGATATYDPVRDQMVVYGGSDGGAIGSHLWLLSLAGSPSWTMIGPGAPSPGGRNFHTAIYDPVRDRILLFGGQDENFTLLNDVWALSLAGNPSWTPIYPAGVPPTARYFHTAIYDPVRDRMLMFGGFDENSTEFNDVWALSLSGSPTWNELAPSGTPPSVGVSATYDPVRDRMLVFGGSGENRLHAWALSLSAGPSWSEITATGIPPSAREVFSSIYDAVSDRVIGFGGYGGGSFLNEVWELSLAGTSSWSSLAPSGPPPPARAEHVSIYDPIRHRMLVFAGQGEGVKNDVWALSLSGSAAWSTPAPAEPPGPVRGGHSATYDPVRSRMLVFGGRDGSEFRNDVWVLPLSGRPVWSELAPAGTPPSPRSDHSAIYDPVRDRIVIFGGWDGAAHNDVWALSLSGTPTWSELTPAGTPPSPRVGHSAIYDPVRDRMVVHDGYQIPLSEVWELSFAGSPTWSHLSVTGSPPAVRSGHTAFYDPVRDRMVVFGGRASDVWLNDVWALSLSGSPGWSPIHPAGTPPSERGQHAAIYDPTVDRLVVYGGRNSLVQSDVWALRLSGQPVWYPLTPGSARYAHSAIFDPQKGRMVIFGGLVTPDSPRNDAWALEWGNLVSVPEADATASRLALAAPRPNPSFGPVALNFNLPQSGKVSLVIYDATGRTVRKLVDGPMPAGESKIRWDGRDRVGRAVPPGIYLVRLAASGAQIVKKAVISPAGSPE